MKTKQTIRRSVMGLLAMTLILSMGCEQEKEARSEEGPVDPPKQIISIEDAATLFKEYTEGRVPHVVAALDSTEQESFVPARYTDFDYKVIKEYIAYIEQEAKAAKKDIKTLRIYYGVYPSDKGDKSKKATVFLVPSTDFNGENMAFQVSRVGESTEAVPIPWDFGTGIKEMGMQMQQDQRQYATFGPMPASSAPAPVQRNGSLVLNDGNTAPPPYN